MVYGATRRVIASGHCNNQISSLNCFKDNKLVLIFATILARSAKVKLLFVMIRQYLAPAYILRTLSPVDFKA